MERKGEPVCDGPNDEEPAGRGEPISERTQHPVQPKNRQFVHMVHEGEPENNYSALNLKEKIGLVMLVVLVLGTSASLAVASVSSPAATCPTYLTNLVVDVVDSTPQTATVGTVVVTKVHVTYGDGSPATLSPETLSFLWHGTEGDKTIKDVHVVPLSDPGYYTYTQTVGEDFPTGLVVISVMFCSGSDTSGNYGPVDDVNSDTTISPTDVSKVQIGPLTTEVETTTTTQPPTLQELLAMYAVPIAIAILVLVAVLLLAIRGRSRKK